MDYHRKFFTKLSSKVEFLPWAGWIKVAFRDSGVNLDRVPDDEFNKIVVSMSSLIAGLVQCQKKRTYTKLLGQEMKKYFDELREKNNAS